jgi:hypothetical protein
VKLFHGTSARRAADIRGGLWRGSFVTRDFEWAKTYAKLAACRDGTPDNRLGLIVTVEAAPSDLIPDPHPHAAAEQSAALIRRLPVVSMRRVRFRDLEAASPETIREIASISWLERVRDGRSLLA